MRIRWNIKSATDALQNKCGDSVKIKDGVNFESVDTEMIFVCNIHGEFSSTLYRVLHSKYNCPNCSPTARKGWAFMKSKLEHKYGKLYEYYLNDLATYKSGSKIKIICKNHGVFEKTYYDHINGEGCPECKKQMTELTVNDFLYDSIKHHGNKYEYDFIFDGFINSRSLVKIICKKHGEFTQRANDHRNGAGCPNCNNSRGESAIRTFLIRHNVEFITQKTYSDCLTKSNRPYKFDFHLPKSNTLIEFDGQQHRENTFYNNFNVGKIIESDTIKDQYAKRNDINLIRISSLKEIDNKLIHLI